MTKVLHVADVHMGLVTHSVPDPATGIPSRILDVARCWQAAVRVGIENDVDAAIVAGDIFHTANPDATSLALFAEGLRELEGAGIPTLLLAGNHERSPHPGRPCVLDAFAGPAVTVATAPGVHELADLVVASLPSVSRHQLMAGAGGWRSQTDQDLVDALRRILDGFRASVPDVLIGHWPVAGSVLGGETDIAIIPEPMLAPADLEDLGYVAFGHIHRAQQIADVGWYPGSIDRLNFGEESYDPVALTVELEDQDVHRWSSPARRFLTFDVDHEDLTPGTIDVEDAIVRILNVPPDAAEEFRRHTLAAGAQSVRIQVKREQTRAPRAAQVHEAAGPIDALERYLDARGFDEDDRPRIREAAKALVA